MAPERRAHLALPGPPHAFKAELRTYGAFGATKLVPLAMSTGAGHAHAVRRHDKLTPGSVLRERQHLHYDPGYQHSTRRSYGKRVEAAGVALESLDRGRLAKVAQRLAAADR